MQKLTKEQADWWIKYLTNEYCTGNLYARQPDKKITLVGVKKYNECDSESGLLIDIWHKDNTDGSLSLICLNASEFKQFTAGCQKICDWLQEQEEDSPDIYACDNDMQDK